MEVKRFITASAARFSREFLNCIEAHDDANGTKKKKISEIVRMNINLAKEVQGGNLSSIGKNIELRGEDRKKNMKKNTKKYIENLKKWNCLVKEVTCFFFDVSIWAK